MVTRRLFLAGLSTLITTGAARAQAVSGDDAPLRFGRFEHEGSVRYGFLGAGGIQELKARIDQNPDGSRHGKCPGKGVCHKTRE